MLFSDHIYYGAIAFKMTEQVEQQICIKFCVKLEHSSAETIWMIQKATAMSSWWWAAGDWQLHHDNMPTHALCLVLVQSFVAKHQITKVPQPIFGTLRLLAFPKTKITFEREEISDHHWDSGKYDRAADGNWENCVRFWGPYIEGDWGFIVLCTTLLVFCIFFSKCLFFILHGWIPSGQAAVYSR